MTNSQVVAYAVNRATATEGGFGKTVRAVRLGDWTFGSFLAGSGYWTLVIGYWIFLQVVVELKLVIAGLAVLLKGANVVVTGSLGVSRIASAMWTHSVVVGNNWSGSTDRLVSSVDDLEGGTERLVRMIECRV